MLPKEKALFSERAADREIIKSLQREIKRLKGDLPMSKVIKSQDGKLYLVHSYEELDGNDAQDLLSGLREDVTVLESVVDRLAYQPADPAPVATEQPAPAADQPAPAPSDSQPAADSAPADVPASEVPAAPAEPAAAPAPDALTAQDVQPAVDPNAPGVTLQ